jgi:hypothetical protein
MILAALSVPAKANVVYNLTFAGGGAGKLVLNFSSAIAATNISYTSIAPYFVSLSVDNVHGQNFLVNSSNLADGYISTGPLGQLYTLTVEEMQPNGVPTGTGFLDIYTNSWQVHETPWNDILASDSLTIGSLSTVANAPAIVASASEPSTLAVTITGLCALGFLAYCKRRGKVTATGD